MDGYWKPIVFKRVRRLSDMDTFNLTPTQQEELNERDGLLKQEMFAIVDDARAIELEREVFDLEKESAFVNDFLAYLKSIGARTETPA
jgi:hypothetical protein